MAAKKGSQALRVSSTVLVVMTPKAIVTTSLARARLGVSVATNKGNGDAVAAAPAFKFDFCSGARRVDCVVDGDTFYLASERISISGMDAPEIRSAACSAEVRLGVDASVRLRRMLNDGVVTLDGPSFGRGTDGAAIRKVMIDGVDVARVMTGAGLAHAPAAGQRSWC